MVKNNLCATGEPITLSKTTFKSLQRKTSELKNAGEITYGKFPPEDRSKLHDVLTVDGASIGEGTVVRYVELVSEARHSNFDSGESVNCDKKGAAANEIHLDVLPYLTDTACQRVSAEMIPHLRPTSWNRVAGTGAKRKRVDPFEGTPIRITGQLFFDGSHTPCGEPTGGADGRFLARVSNWEIHPVYAIDVCALSSLSECPVDDESVWTPLHEEDPE